MAKKQGFLGDNIRGIRMDREMDQAEVAEKADISRAAFQKIERGESIPKISTLLRIAEALDVELTYLVREIPRLKYVRFRSDKKLKKREHVLFCVSRWLKNFKELQEIMGNEREYALSDVEEELRKSPEKGKEKAKKAADKAREALGLNLKEPIWDVCSLLEDKAGIKVYLIEFQSEGFYGLSVGEKDGGPAVAVSVSNRLPIERSIFSAIHELGHLLLHFASFDAQEVGENRAEEDEANAFASYFLMPDEAFKRYLDKAAGQSFLDWLFTVKRVFLVSYKTVLMRLIEMGRVDKNNIWAQVNRLYQAKYHKKLGFTEEPRPISSDHLWSNTLRESEPESLKPADFRDNWLRLLVRQAYEQDKIGSGRAAEILGLDRSSFMDLVGQWRIMDGQKSKKRSELHCPVSD